MRLISGRVKSDAVIHNNIRVSKMKTVDRRVAQSGNVSYSDAVVLHETTRTRITFLPFFIKRSEGTDLSIKITTHKKAPPPNNWVIVEEKSISLGESASRKLVKALKEHFTVAEEDEDGNYIIIKVNEGTAHFGEHEPLAVANALAKILSQEEILEHISNTNFSDELVNALRGAIKLKEMTSAVSQLRMNLNEGVVDESIYQNWCDAHSWAFGNAYVLRDEVREISPGDNLDLLLPTVISGYRDIVELKRPNMTVLNHDNSHRNYYYSAEASKAIGQCHRYLDVLHEEASKGLRDHPEIVAYHPRAIIVIGRSNDWDSEKSKALHGLNRRMSEITIMTYDQLLAQGERLVEILSDHSEEENDTTQFEDKP